MVSWQPLALWCFQTSILQQQVRSATLCREHCQHICFTLLGPLSVRQFCSVLCVTCAPLIKRFHSVADAGITVQSPEGFVIHSSQVYTRCSQPPCEDEELEEEAGTQFAFVSSAHFTAVTLTQSSGAEAARNTVVCSQTSVRILLKQPETLHCCFVKLRKRPILASKRICCNAALVLQP
jgi:hypothetical protein